MTYKNEKIIQALKNGMDIMRLLRRAIHPLRVSDIARSTGLSADQVYRSLLTLEMDDFVERVDTGSGVGRWVLGEGLLVLISDTRPVIDPITGEVML